MGICEGEDGLLLMGLGYGGYALLDGYWYV